MKFLFLQILFLQFCSVKFDLPAILIASLPERRTTAMAPFPKGVARATMVSSMLGAFGIIQGAKIRQFNKLFKLLCCKQKAHNNLLILRAYL